MEDPLLTATELVARILSRVGYVKTNEEECKVLARMAEQTLQVLENLEIKDLSNPSVSASVELLTEALNEACNAVENCCTAAFFSALLWHDHYSMPLQNAASNLDHALSQLSLASSRTTANIHSSLAMLSQQLRQAEIGNRNAIAQQTIVLKKELEKGFYQQIQDNQEAKRLIRELIEGRTLMIQDFSTELRMLNEASREAKVNKETQMEHELKQVIEVLSESMTDASQDQVFIPSLTKALCCPVTAEIMRDPVLLKESGRIYDRSSITKRFQQGHLHDPVTNEELVSVDFVRCYALRDVSHALLEHLGESATIVEELKKDDSEAWFAPGLYEGHGKISNGYSKIYAFQLLVLEPNGVAMGCTVYNKESFNIQRKGIEHGGGQWDHHALQISFGDSCFNYHGEAYRGSSQGQAMLKWKGRATSSVAQYKEHGFLFAYTSPPIARALMPYPRILQMESNGITFLNDVQCTSKLVVSLELDFIVGGWLWFESTAHKHKTIGCITDGRWEMDGNVAFEVSFSHPHVKLNSHCKPTNYLAIFQVSGYLSRSTRTSLPTFSAKFLKTKEGKMLLTNHYLSLLPHDGDVLDYPCLREASTPWHHLYQSPLKLFQVAKSYDLESFGDFFKGDFNVTFGLSPYCNREKEWNKLHIASQNNFIDFAKEFITKGGGIEFGDIFRSRPLHIASERGSIDVVKELISRGANIECQVEDGWTPLHFASRNNHIDVVKELISNGANIECQEEKRWTPLLIASSKNHIDVVKELISKGANIECQEEKGWTPLLVASSKNHIDVVKELISKGADTECQQVNGSTPLHLASENNHIDVLQELIAEGANIECQDENGETPLHVATYSVAIDVIKELISNGANIECQTNGGSTPLHFASKNNAIDVVKELISKGANIECQAEEGWTPLHVASQNNHIDVVKELISKGANIECQTNGGSTPLHVASANNHIDVVKELISKGANIECQNKDGRTPLHIASHYNHIDVVKELISKGANIECQNKDGWTPLHVASKNNHIDVLKELISRGANIECQVEDGWTPLHFASRNNHIDVVKELISNGANIECQEEKRWTPLLVASSKNHIDVVKELISKGANIECLNKDKETPLHLASKTNSIVVVKALIAEGSYVDFQDENGCTPLHVASKRGLVSIIHILLEYGASKNIRNNEAKIPYDIACTDECFASFEEATVDELATLLKP